MRVYLRGVGNFDDQVTQDPSVAIYMDGVYVARSQGLAMEVADLERIEVLRGPQGTLYGRNATGGAINFVTRAPEPGEWGFSQQLTAGSRELLRSRSALNAPLGENAALRLGYLTATEDGFVESRGTGEDRSATATATPGAPTCGGRRATTSRCATPTTVPTSAIRRLHRRGAARDELRPAPARAKAGVQGLAPTTCRAEGHSLILGWQLSDQLELKSISAYRELEDFQNQDYHSGLFGPAPIFRNAFEGSQEQWSQEFQLLGGTADDSIEYILGLYWFDEEGDRGGATTNPARGVRTLTCSEIDNSAEAVFGQISWTPEAFDGRLHLTGGLRWSADQRSATLDRARRSLRRRP